jgi:hypothetical protein
MKQAVRQDNLPDRKGIITDRTESRLAPTKQQGNSDQQKAGRLGRHHELPINVNGVRVRIEDGVVLNPNPARVHW